MAITDEYLPLDALLPDTANYNQHSGESVARLASQIVSVGFTAPFLVDAKTKLIAAGHRRRLALLKLKGEGHAEPEGVRPGWLVPCRVGEWSELQRLKVLVGDNPDPAALDYDTEQLTALLSELSNAGELDGSGYDEARLEALIGELAGETGSSSGQSGLLEDADPDEVPEDAPTRCQPGDLWQLGEHRLLCGDSTKAEDVERLMGGERAAMMWTDPPYGVSYVGKTAEALTIENDGAEGLPVLLRGAFAQATEALTPGAPFYIAHPPGALCLTFGQAIIDAGWRFHQTLIWCKDAMVLGHSDYHFQHEPIYYGWTPGEGRSGRGNHEGSRWRGDHAQVSVFHVDRPKRSEDHPTSKPVELLTRALGNSSRPGEVIYEPFCGSGSTLIACEETGRRCYALELAERYCDVILARWEKATGREAVLLSRVSEPALAEV